ncbi:MAG: AAA family ATPase [Trueperaceae bacterium]
MSFIESHFATSQRLIQRVESRFQRFLYPHIDWRQPLIFLVGMRGVGKTTLLLQHLKHAFGAQPSRALYLTADDVNLGGVRLVDVAEEFVARYAGKTLVIDEVHKYPNWSQELKNIFDLQPDLQVIASGSSSLSIVTGQYDLSRRSLVYHLPQLSLREFLNLEHGLQLEPIGLPEVLRGHETLVPEIISVLKDNGTAILERFRRYLAVGAYPYSQGKESFDYHRQVVNSITKVLYEDIPSTFDVSPQTPVTLQRLLNLLTTSEPYQPNVERLARTLGIAKETTYNYLDHLERSSLIAYLPQSRAGSKAVRKPAKIYLSNPNLYFALGQVKGLEVKEGTMRESFFLSQIGVQHRATAHPTADFTVGGKTPYVFEVGGKGKARKQLNEVEAGFLALDDMEYGLGKSVPLWLFGFLY